MYSLWMDFNHVSPLTWKFWNTRADCHTIAWLYNRIIISMSLTYYYPCNFPLIFLAISDWCFVLVRSALESSLLLEKCSFMVLLMFFSHFPWLPLWGKTLVVFECCIKQLRRGFWRVQNWCLRSWVSIQTTKFWSLFPSPTWLWDPNFQIIRFFSPGGVYKWLIWSHALCIDV